MPVPLCISGTPCVTPLIVDPLGSIPPNIDKRITIGRWQNIETTLRPSRNFLPAYQNFAAKFWAAGVIGKSATETFSSNSAIAFEDSLECCLLQIQAFNSPDCRFENFQAGVPLIVGFHHGPGSSQG